jgi:5-methylcytosine-specific restriction endonuclease McrA
MNRINSGGGDAKMPRRKRKVSSSVSRTLRKLSGVSVQVGPFGYTLSTRKGTSMKRKRESCPKAVKEAVWRKYCKDKLTGKCYVCRRPIYFTFFEVGHNKAYSKGGTWNIQNLRPICRTCNRSMGTTPIETFKRKYFGKVKPIKKPKPIRESRKKRVEELKKELEMSKVKICELEEKKSYLQNEISELENEMASSRRELDKAKKEFDIKIAFFGAVKSELMKSLNESEKIMHELKAKNREKS